jgi:hypothetical protein
MSDSLEYNLPKNAYINFDALSLKDFIIQRLNENPKFTDQNYEGSNLASFIDIIAYSYHTLLFYLNQTGSEALFSQTSLYENMNKIVNLVGYNPTGKQTSIVPVTCLASASLAAGNYTLRKYSYFLVNNIQYTILNDFSFEKTTSGSEKIDSIENNLILYQGTVQEYPIYTAEGKEFETFPVVVDNLVDENDDRFIAHGTLAVYVKEIGDATWYEYDEIDNLFLTPDSDRYYSVRLNENGHYEIKFGNDVFGKKLTEGDQVAVYYILSDNDKGIISKNVINGNKLFNFNTSQFTAIYNDVITVDPSSIIDLTNNATLNFSNTANSTAISDGETVDQIRQNVPKYLSSQLRLVTEVDYDTYLTKNLSNVLQSVEVVNNKRFIDEYIDYFYSICVDPNKSNRVILNQVNFADSCDFNNVNIFVVPKFVVQTDAEYPPFLSNSLKNLIIDSTSDKKMLSHEVVPRDPIYTAFDIGYSAQAVDKDVYLTSKLEIVRTSNSKINKENLKKRIINIILDFFNPLNNSLGQRLDLSDLTSTILGLEGVDKIRTRNGNEIFNGISFISWNPVYEGVDEEFVTQTTTLPFFKFPYFYRPQTIGDRILITDSE